MRGALFVGILAAVSVTGVLVGSWFLVPKSEKAAVLQETDTAAGPSAGRESALHPAVPLRADAVSSSPQASPVRSWSERLRASEDLDDFAERALTAAVKGDVDAAYHLSAALAYCDEGDRAFFDRGERRRTLDEALQWASTRQSIDMGEIRRVHALCERLKRDPQWGPQTAAAWLEKAAQLGHPLAEATLAANILADTEIGLAAADDQETARMLRTRQQDARDLLRKALNSKHPAVLWQVGDVYRLATGATSSAQADQWVWRLAACQRGYDCSESAVWHGRVCFVDPYCQPGETGIDYIRRSSGDDFSAVERQATMLNRLLDSTESENLDLNELMERVGQNG